MLNLRIELRYGVQSQNTSGIDVEGKACTKVLSS